MTHGNFVNKKLRQTADTGLVQPRKKCCGKCAFRKGSPERTDPYAWMQLVESWRDNGVPFFCHEGVPGHSQQVEGQPLHICAGYHATQDIPEHRLLDLAEIGKSLCQDS